MCFDLKNWRTIGNSKKEKDMECVRKFFHFYQQKSFMANVGKKWDFFQGLIFVLQSLICGFGKIFEKKVVEKWIISWERLETCLCLKVSKKETLMYQSFFVHPNLSNVILPESASKCWSLMHVEKKSTEYWHITNPKLQHFFGMMWKMMDIVASRNQCVFFEKVSKCLIILLEVIYF